MAAEDHEQFREKGNLFSTHLVECVHVPLVPDDHSDYGKEAGLQVAINIGESFSRQLRATQ